MKTDSTLEKQQANKQMSISVLEKELHERLNAEQSSIAQGNTPDVHRQYDFQQQTDIQRKDQKPHIQPSPAPDQGPGKGKLPDATVIDNDPLQPDDPAHPERYVSNTPYHR